MELKDAEMTTYDPSKEITADQAIVIVNEALAGGFYAETPPTPEAMIDAARDLVQSAYVAREAKSAYPEVHSIIAVYENGAIEEQPPWEDPTPEEPVAEAAPEPEPVAAPADPEPVLVVEKPKRKKRAEKVSTGDPVDDLIAREGLPIPPEVDDPSMGLPSDFTALSDVEVRRYHSTFHALFARASWVLACEENDLAAAQNMHDMAQARAMKDSVGDKVTVAKAEAAADPEVMEWRQKVVAHSSVVKRLKALASYYESTCKTLSREWTMRTGERESAGSLHQRFN